MSGGFTPGLRTISDGVEGGPSFLASEHYAAKRVGVTLDADAVTADADGNKVLEEGTFVTPDSGSGKYVPYTAGTGDPPTGGSGADANVSGYTFEGVNLKDGDVVCGILIHGSVLAARVTPAVDDTISGATAGRIIYQ